MLSAADAQKLIDEAQFIWHQRFELAPGVFTPGANDIGSLMAQADIHGEFAGKSVLDIGTTNGAIAFEAERAGATDVVAVDIYGPDRFGFDVLADALDSRVQFVRSSVYELPQRLNRTFDVVIFWGVLYHLRHPLLALDAVYRLTHGLASVESAVADAELDGNADAGTVRFYRRDELAGDTSNWFSPSLACLVDWCGSSGLEPTKIASWPDPRPVRALVHGRPVHPPEYQELSYEVPLTVSAPTDNL